MSALALRRVDTLTHTRLQTVQRWQQGGHCAGTGRPESAGVLSFLARGELGDWRGLIVARDWLHRSLPLLESLQAVECPATSIATLFRAVPRALLLNVDELQYRELDDIQLLDSAQGEAEELPWLDTARGRVWFTQLPPDQPQNAALEPSTWLEDLPLQLDLLLGVSHLDQPSVLRLGPGDVLQINQLTHQCVLANRGIGVFTFTEEGLLMELTVDESTSQEEAGLDHLPVRLEFVVATHDVELGTLRQMVAGQLIPLAANAAQQIEVRANGKRVARGELVQLDGQLGVELLEVYRNRGDE
jgi:type III secretion protein Q